MTGKPATAVAKASKAEPVIAAPPRPELLGADGSTVYMRLADGGTFSLDVKDAPIWALTPNGGRAEPGSAEDTEDWQVILRRMRAVAHMPGWTAVSGEPAITRGLDGGLVKAGK